MTQYKRLHRPALGLSICQSEMFTLHLRRLRAVSKHNLSPSAWLLPSRMRPVIELLHNTVGTVEDVVNGHTLLPLAARFMPLADFDFVKAHFLGDPQHGLPSKVGMAGPRSGWAKVRLLRCPKCVEEDIGCCGNPFWRRENLVPGSLFCGEHKLPLHETCGDCMNYEKNPLLTLHAGYHCGCGLKPLSEAAGLSDELAQAEIELSTIAAKLLDAHFLPNLDHNSVAAAVAQAAVGHGLVRNGLFSSRSALEFLATHPLSPVLKRTGFFSAAEGELKMIFKGEKTLRHPIEALLLLRLLHEDWQQVENVFASKPERPPAADTREQRAFPKAPNKNSLLKKERHKKTLDRCFKRLAPLYAKARSLHPEMSITQLLRLLPPTARIVLFESRLQRAGYDVPLVQKNNVRNQELDRELADYIEERGRQLRLSNYPKRITLGDLLEGSRRPKAFSQKTLRPHLVRARDAAKKWSEDAAQCKRRLSSIQTKTA